MLKIEEYEKVLKFVSLIQDDHEDYFQTILNSLKHAFGYTNLSLYINDKSIQSSTTFYSEMNVSEEVKNYYYRVDWFNKENIQHKSLISIEEIVTYAQHHGIEYYTNFVEKKKLYHTIFIPLKWESNIIGVIGIHKTIQTGDFTENEKEILESASKFISNNLKRYIEYNQLTFLKSILNHSMSKLPLGVLVLDHELSIVYNNQLVYDYCPELHSNNSILLTKIKEILLTKLHLEDESSIKDLQFNFEELSIKISPWMKETRDLVEQQFVIYIYPQNQLKEDPLKKATIEFGLSKRESEIIDLISKGYSNNEIASKLFLSINTVKSHLNNIFNKLGVNNRTSVIHKISANF
ncbi:hypothetical protein BTR23_01605 [Alkalihalophilus pseudofirmus]|nr:hypothetical protein BTR23_01605 [Alkalihalophilus pseudofirmus]